MISAAIAISPQYAGETAMRKIAAAFLLIGLLAVSAFLIYLAIPRISIALLAKTYDLNISYRSVCFTPHIGRKDTGGFKVDIDLENVRISRKGAVAGAYDNFEALVSAPLDGSLKYRSIKGVIRPRPGHIIIDDLLADGGDIKVSLKGVFFYIEDRVDLDVMIQFSKVLLEKIPQELSAVILKESSEGWSSFSVNLKGSFKAPAIEVTGRLFRLSIKEVSGS
jgi:hypothetical protein